MARRPTPEGRDYAKEAARAHTDLNIFHAVINLMDGGFVSAPAGPDAQRIVRLCRDAAERCLRRYDAALAKLPTKEQA